MSEETPVRGIILGHGYLADGYVDAVRQITGIEEDAVVALSNKGLSPETLADRLRSMVGGGPAVVFTDLPAGSCGFAARRICQQIPNAAVVTGVNLAVLLEFVMHRNEPLETLVPRLIDKGRAAVCCAPSRFEGAPEYEHHAATR